MCICRRGGRSKRNLGDIPDPCQGISPKSLLTVLKLLNGLLSRTIELNKRTFLNLGPHRAA